MKTCASKQLMMSTFDLSPSYSVTKAGFTVNLSVSLSHSGAQNKQFNDVKTSWWGQRSREGDGEEKPGCKARCNVREREVWVNVHLSECVCSLFIHHGVCVCVWERGDYRSGSFGYIPLSHAAILPAQTAVGLMVLVPLRSMQISSPVFRHEHWEATNRNRREAALTPPRLLQEKKKETRGWKYGIRFQPFGKYPQFDQKFIMWLLEQLGFPGDCCCTLHSYFNVVNTLKHTALHSVSVCACVCVCANAIWVCVCVWVWER